MLPLPAETLIIEGPDAIAFAQAQLASDVSSLKTGAWQWSAWLNSQGRVRALMQLMRPDEHQLRLLLRGGTAAAMAAALQPYVLRSHVNLAAQAPQALTDAAPGRAGSMHIDDEGTVLDMGDYAMRIAPPLAKPTQRWRLDAVRAGHPWLPDAALDAVLAPSLALQATKATSLNKGCYPGQEIVARMYYRGGGKQHLMHVESDTPLPPGGSLSVNNKPVGIILDSAPADNETHLALAVLRDTAARGETLVRVNENPEKRMIISELA